MSAGEFADTFQVLDLPFDPGATYNIGSHEASLALGEELFLPAVVDQIRSIQPRFHLARHPDTWESFALNQAGWLVDYALATPLNSRNKMPDGQDPKEFAIDQAKARAEWVLEGLGTQNVSNLDVLNARKFLITLEAYRQRAHGQAPTEQDFNRGRQESGQLLAEYLAAKNKVRNTSDFVGNLAELVAFYAYFRAGKYYPFVSTYREERNRRAFYNHDFTLFGEDRVVPLSVEHVGSGSGLPHLLLSIHIGAVARDSIDKVLSARGRRNYSVSAGMEVKEVQALYAKAVQRIGEIMVKEVTNQPLDQAGELETPIIWKFVNRVNGLATKSQARRPLPASFRAEPTTSG